MFLPYMCRCLLASVAIIAAMPGFAHDQEADPPVGGSIFAPKDIYLAPSPETVEVAVSEDISLALPQYKKIERCHSFYTSVDNRLVMSDKLDAESLKNKLAEQEELRELAQKLQVGRLDTVYLDFYREVAGWLGTRYRMGSMSRKAVDCSGFTKIIYNTVFNKDIPRTSRDMSNSLSESLAIDELHPGDLVFFATRGKKYINHVGMYLGEGNFVHASIRGVKVSPLTDGYYQKTWRKAGRIDSE